MNYLTSFAISIPVLIETKSSQYSKSTVCSYLVPLSRSVSSPLSLRYQGYECHILPNNSHTFNLPRAGKPQH